MTTVHTLLRDRDEPAARERRKFPNSACRAYSQLKLYEVRRKRREIASESCHAAEYQHQRNLVPGRGSMKPHFIQRQSIINGNRTIMRAREAMGHIHGQNVRGHNGQAIRRIGNRRITPRFAASQASQQLHNDRLYGYPTGTSCWATP